MADQAERKYAAKRVAGLSEDTVLRELRRLESFQFTGGLSETGKWRFPLVKAEVERRGLEHRKKCPACGGSGWVKT